VAARWDLAHDPAMRSVVAVGRVVPMTVIAFQLVRCEVRSCEDIGCINGVTLQAAMDPAADLPLAKYRVEVIADGESFGCELVVANQPSCRQEDALFVRARSSDGKPGIDRLEIETPNAPTKLDVTVFRDDVEVGHASYTPEYTVTRVGSGDCRKECSHAELSLVISE
jgi:hypothetical protein